MKYFRGIRGFTLVELLVVIGIMAGLFVVLAPNLSGFNRRQLINEAASTLHNSLRTTQANAASGLKCGPENDLRATEWRLYFGNSIVQYRYHPLCSTNSAANNVPITSVFYPSGVKLQKIIVKTSTVCEVVESVTGGADKEDTIISFENISAKVGFSAVGTLGYCQVKANEPDSQLWIAVGFDGTQKKDWAVVVVEKGGSIYITSEQIP